MASEILRPEANGDTIQNTPSAGANWQCVDDTGTGDDGATTVSPPATKVWKLDLYELPTAVEDEATISKVVIKAKVNTALGLDKARICIKTHSTEYRGAIETQTPWGYISREYSVNPNTSAAWTWGEITALQVGIELYEDDIKGAGCACTQVYAEVVFGCSEPTVTTQDATGIGATSATLHGTIVSVNDGSCDERGFDFGLKWVSPTSHTDDGSCWNLEAQLYDEDVEVGGNHDHPWDSYASQPLQLHSPVTLNATGFRFHVWVGGWFCKKFKCEFYYDAGWHLVFEDTTVSGAGWHEITDLTERIIEKCRVNVASDGSSIQAGFFEFDFYDMDDWTEEGSFGAAAFDHEITGLETGYTYYFRAKAHNEYGWGYGDWKEFIPTGAQEYTRSATALLGLLGAKSRTISLTRSDTGLLGLLPSYSKAISISRTKTGLLGLLPAYGKSIVLIRGKTGLLGLATTATRPISLSRSATSLLGLKGIGSRAVSYIESSTALLGLLSTAAKSLSLTRTKTSLLGLKGAAGRVLVLTRSKVVLLGLKGIGGRNISLTRAAMALLGLNLIATVTRFTKAFYNATLTATRKYTATLRAK